ncbi:hypothetical protein LO763_11700 [Glycomyces sp. A-F 0318]|uniref:hypothetical protein n=1 Tax=Glycomyces amatae TaxID=2881355 RepID=UPI001E65AF37|nr:hypothetical protein [Glycomyces amatae]MCD0444286.1 hypothetical protein [Glycomyces amatae]
MTEPITITLGEGILRRFAIRTANGPVLAVRLFAVGGPLPLRSSGLPDEPIALVAVHLHHRVSKPRPRRGHTLVRRNTIETDHELAAGRVCVFASSGDTPTDAATVQPEPHRDGTWLDEAGLDAVEGKPVRLEIRRLPSASGQHD